MGKIKYTDPNTFVETELEIDDNQLIISEILSNSCMGVYNVTPVISYNGDANRLVFGIMPIRNPGEEPGPKFRVILEKI